MIPRERTIRFGLAVTCAAVLCLASCSSNEDDEDDDSITIGSSGSGGNGASDSSSNLQIASDYMIPDSLDSGTSLALNDDNPCADSEDFFDCQPILVKLYMQIARDVFSGTAEIYDHVSANINNLKVGSSGSLTPDDSEDIDSIDYIVTSASDYELLIKTAAGPFIHIDVNESDEEKIYSLVYNPENSPEDDEGGGPNGQVRVDVAFTDSDNFNVNVQLGGSGCDEDDFRAPQKFVIDVEKGEDQWQGKAMLYHPLWLADDSDGCDATVSDSTKMFMYTDFAGNDENTTASLYMMPAGVDATEAIADYPVSAFCSTFTGTCSADNASGTWGGGITPADYTNEFCITADDAEWGSACSDFSSADYSAESNWTVPTDLADLNVEIPSSL